MRFLPILALLAGLAALACGGDDTVTPSPTPEPVITKEQLALMPLSDAELGIEAGTLEVSDDSGYLTSNVLASDTIDPRDSAVDIEAAGWVASYRLSYEDPTLAKMGFVDGETTLDLFADSASAKAFLDDQIEKTEDLQEEVFFGGFEVRNFSRFDVAGGDEGFGAKLRLRVGEFSASNWVAGFRYGGLVASVSVSRNDDTDMTESLPGLAAKLEERVRGVVAGTAQVTQIPLPTPEPDAPGQAARPEQGPFLDAMALTLSELPIGSAIDEEGYVPDEDNVAYQRSFSLGPRGNGGPFGLEVDLALAPNETEAIDQFDSARFAFLGPDGQALIEESLASQPFEVSNVSIREAAATQVGDDSFQFAVEYRLAFGNWQADFVNVRIGRVIGTLIFSGFAGQLDQGYVNSLMMRFVSLIEAELATV